MNVIIYDVEIENCIAAKGEIKNPRYNYCGGWNDYAGMGIAVVCAYDYAQRCYRVFTERNLEDFVALIAKTDAVIGFNSSKFDDALCVANGIEIVTDYDLFTQVRMASGQSESGPCRRGYGLGALASANIGDTKSGDGGSAPKMWQEGNYGGVIDYCLHDVHLTKCLVDLAMKNGELKDPTTGSRLIMPHLKDVIAANRAVRNGGQGVLEL